MHTLLHRAPQELIGKRTNGSASGTCKTEYRVKMEGERGWMVVPETRFGYIW